MVFFDDRYENIEEAQAHRGGLAVIAVMVEVGIIVIKIIRRKFSEKNIINIR